MDAQTTKTPKIMTLAKLVDFGEDLSNYINYVFQLLDKDDIDRFNTKYLICTRYPNWDHKTLHIGDEGYLSCEEVLSGITEWYDGKKFNRHNYDHFHFIKFVPLKKEVKNEIVL